MPHEFLWPRRSKTGTSARSAESQVLIALRLLLLRRQWKYRIEEVVLRYGQLITR